MIENDETRNAATPAVVIAGARTGGTFLAHCLSTHSQIFFDRSESLHHGSIWHRNLALNRIKLLDVLLHMPGYRVSGCKLLYQQAFKCEVWQHLIMRARPRAIWLVRENVIRQAISLLVQQQARRGQARRPAHSFETPPPLRIELPPEAVLRTARRLVELDKTVAAAIGQLDDVIKLTYEQVTGGVVEATRLPTRIGKIICEFFGVRYEPMSCELRRVNGSPLREALTNWPDIEAMFSASEFAAQLEMENAKREAEA
jgi:hypothetical protein